MPKKNNKPLIVFSLASFFNDVGSDMIKPIWPLFVTVFLGFDVAILGLIDGIGSAIESLSQTASGYLSDKIKRRKPFIVFGYLFSGISRIGYALAKAWPVLLLFHALDRTGKMRDAPRDVYLAESTRKRHRVSSFGLLTAMDSLGAFVGIILSIFLFPIVGFVGVLLIAAVPSLVSVFLVWKYIGEVKGNGSKRNRMKMALGDILKDKRIIVFYVSGFFIGLALFSYSFFLLYANASGADALFVPVLYLIFKGVMSISAYSLGRIGDAAGRKTSILIAHLLYIITLAGFIYANSLAGIIIMFVFYGLFSAMFNPSYTVYLAEIAPREYKGTVLGGYRLIIGLTALPASVIAGLLWSMYGSHVAFLFGTAAVILSAIVLLFGELLSKNSTKKSV